AVNVVLEADAPRALERLTRGTFDAVVADINMPGLSGLELLRAAKKTDAELPFILITAFPGVESAVQALRDGALDYLIKPFHPDDLRLKVARALEQRRLKGEHRLLTRHLTREYATDGIVGASPSILEVLALVDKVAATAADVLILGESGTGKELIARRLHARSGRRGRFVPVDCGAIPENLLENEFFGHERGAYTDAGEAAPGLLEFADHGTFFMDEVGELPGGLQAKLLRALQERQFRRVGGNAVQSVDVRVVAATNRDLKADVAAGRFRSDLFYRLNVVAIRVPPLRERPDDIRLLLEHFLPRYSKELDSNVLRVDPAALEILTSYSWPGNIRELQNVLKRSILLCGRSLLRPEDLPENLVSAPTEPLEARGGFVERKRQGIQAFEREYFDALLKEHHGNAKAAAQAAALPLSNLYWYLKKYGLQPRLYR
ncbi:MAG: sigma-54-dependent Fis family transcriptional regulator, partial [Elusimicrobia bacterium]|nr:sigma-54-dependent Fis family transcriptional regulator [Elusimicrobiota bacterium]